MHNSNCFWNWGCASICFSRTLKKKSLFFRHAILIKKIFERNLPSDSVTLHLFLLQPATLSTWHDAACTVLHHAAGWFCSVLASPHVPAGDADTRSPAQHLQVTAFFQAWDHHRRGLGDRSLVPRAWKRRWGGGLWEDQRGARDPEIGGHAAGAGWDQLQWLHPSWTGAGRPHPGHLLQGHVRSGAVSRFCPGLPHQGARSRLHLPWRLQTRPKRGAAGHFWSYWRLLQRRLDSGKVEIHHLLIIVDLFFCSVHYLASLFLNEGD